jgi:head-tail adaptor
MADYSDKFRATATKLIDKFGREVKLYLQDADNPDGYVLESELMKKGVFTNTKDDETNVIVSTGSNLESYRYLVDDGVQWNVNSVKTVRSGDGYIVTTFTARKDYFDVIARHNVTLQAFAVIDDGYGGQSGDWTDLITVRAIIEPKSGSELAVNQSVENTVDSMITIRYIGGLESINEAGRIRTRYDSRYFNVLSVRNAKDIKMPSSTKSTQIFEGRNYQILTCREERRTETESEYLITEGGDRLVYEDGGNILL